MKLRVNQLAVVILLCASSLSLAQQTAPARNAVNSTSNLATDSPTPSASDSQPTYLLKYQLKQGEKLAWDVEHVASTKTRMAGETEETSSRSVSRKIWTVSNVDSEGNMTFSHTIESVDMWQKIGDDEPISYNSRTDKEAPYEYESTAARLGKTLATITISPDGQVKHRETSLKEMKFGVGDIAVPLPAQPIQIGTKWNVTTSFQAVDEDQKTHQLKARIVYQLVKVTEGNAFITFRTEILTPVESEKIQSQIMQQKTKGYLVFDLSQGRLIRKEVEWNERVQGFEGGDSFLEYIARMSEKFVPDHTPPTPVATLAPLKTDVAEENSVSENDETATIRK
jgi:hypothetical protein